MRNRERTDLLITTVFLLTCVLTCILIVPKKVHELAKTITLRKFDRRTSAEFESSINSNFPNKNFFVDLNGLVHRMLLQREMNGVLLLKNGHESQTTPKRDEKLIRKEAESIKEFSDWLSLKGIKFLYVQIPGKIDSSNPLIPAGKVDCGDQNADEFLLQLKKFGVNYLDIRYLLKEDGINRYSVFLNTEHHWKPEGGFFGFVEICNYLRKNFNEVIPKEITNLENYNVKIYKDSSLGYYGQRTGWIYAGGFDDFSLIWPKWETKQSLFVPHNMTCREGTFYDTIFNTEYLNYNWRERGLYSTYIGGDWPVVIHNSYTSPIDKTVMVIIDSFGTIPEAFLTTVYRNVIGIDLRWVLRSGIEKSIVDFVNEYHPDIVIIAYNSGQIGHPDPVVIAQFEYGMPKKGE